MNILLNSEAALDGTALFVIIGVALLAALYFVLSYIRKRIEQKKCAEAVSEIPEIDDSEEIAAITAAISLILTEEAKEEGREALAFRVVSFKRTNNRRIG